MKPFNLLRCLTLSISFCLLLLLIPDVTRSQTAGGSVVLASCNSSVQFTITEPLGGEAVILNIGTKGNDKARIDYYVNSMYIDSYQISQGDSIRKGGFTNGQIIKIVNIEKGKSGTQCNKRGPGDSDVRVRIPSNCKDIVVEKLTTSSTCGNCNANFNPITE